MVCVNVVCGGGNYLKADGSAPGGGSGKHEGG